MVSLPPAGMASRAFTARFMMICSSCPGSAFTRPSVRVQDDQQLDVLADQPLKQLFRAGHDRVEVEHFGLEHLLAAEGQKLACQ